MDNKLSELSKPKAFVVTGGKMYQDRAFMDKSTAERSKADRHDGAVVEPLYSQEYVSALLAELEAKDKRIAELEECVAELSELETQVKVWESAATKHLALAEEAEKRLATPVRLPRRAPENFASVLDGYEKWLIATTFRDTWNACLDEVSRVSSGFTVEGG